MAESSSIISEFRFISYKIDDFNFEMSKNVSLLGFTENTKTDDWEINLNIKHLQYYFLI